MVGATVAFVIAMGAVGPTSAQPIADIRVEGTQRIDPETVRSYLLLRPGDTADADRLDRALKTLFATGLFADVTLAREGADLIVRVVENPIINRLQFEGNRRVNDDTLNQEIQLRPRVVYTRTKVQNDVKRLLDLYRRSGRFAATVEPKVIQLPQNRVDLVFEIDEGQVTGIRKISIVGNNRFSEGRLRDVLNTKESRWWRFLSTSDSYDPDRLSFDRELLRKFYLAQGYADFRVVSAIAELTPDREEFLVTFTVDEGERYRFGEVEIISRLKDLVSEQLRQSVTTTKGSWYDADAVDESVQKLTDQVGSLGYAFVDVRPRITRDRDQRLIAVTYEVQEGPRVYVDRININGNVRTLDKVVRREMKLAEGDAFNTALLRRSRQRIRNLGFFERVEVNNIPGDAPDRTVVNVEVQEKSTGEISFGIGFSSSDGPLGDIRLRERNLLGRGQDLQVGVLFSGKRNEAELIFEEPYIFDKNIAAGFEIFRITRDFQKETSYDLLSIGFMLRARYQLTEYLRHTVRYTLREDEVSNIRHTASRFIRDQQGTFITSAPGHDLLYDRRDDRFDPTEGYFVRLSQDFAGAGGDNKFIRTRVAVGYYYPFDDEWIGSLTGEIGYIAGFGETVRINHRFFVGGDNLRGFRSSGIGPRDLSTGDALGGKEYAVGSIGTSFPTGLPRELGIRGIMFTDFGTLRNPDVSGQFADSGSIRVSAGMGIAWKSPFGPIRVSVAYPVIKESYDKREIFRFSFGSRF
jgi:outer membrane protein insertion porin family